MLFRKDILPERSALSRFEITHFFKRRVDGGEDLLIPLRVSFFPAEVEGNAVFKNFGVFNETFSFDRPEFYGTLLRNVV